MDFICFRCGQPGHYSASCPTRDQPRNPPAPPAESRGPEADDGRWLPPPVPERRPGVPATTEYLEIKRALGMPTDTLTTNLLSVHCPWCGAGKGIPCSNRATGRRKQVMHEARYATALAPLPPGIPGADLAMQQLADARQSPDCG